MTGVSHAMMSFAIVYGATGKILPAALVSAGAVFPDWIERVVYGKKWMRHHRQESHWFVPYALMASVMGRYLSLHPVDRLAEILDGGLLIRLDGRIGLFSAVFVLFWFSVGCLLHIAEDAFFGPVPVFLPRKRYQLFFQLFKTGGWAEVILSRTVLVFAVMYRYIDGAGIAVW